VARPPRPLLGDALGESGNHGMISMPWVFAARGRQNKYALATACSMEDAGVSDGVRTRDIQSHSLALYQLSYAHRLDPRERGGIHFFVTPGIENCQRADCGADVAPTFRWAFGSPQCRPRSAGSALLLCYRDFLQLGGLLAADAVAGPERLNIADMAEVTDSIHLSILESIEVVNLYLAVG
jgi:hypothetical protein